MLRKLRDRAFAQLAKLRNIFKIHKLPGNVQNCSA